MKWHFRAVLAALILLPHAARAQQMDAPGWRPSWQASGFLMYVRQNSLRGANAVSGTGWGMASLDRQSQRYDIGVSAMLALDPVVLGDCGYPRLLAGTGICAAHTSQDRSHPHPLLMDVGANFTYRLPDTWSLHVRGALAGEPALGPGSYLHRGSAVFDPIAPISHHELNPAHVVNGLVTVGVQRGALALEGSAFNGGAMDDDPYDLDLGSLRSWSARLAWRPRPRTVVQLSTAEFQPAASAHAEHGGAAGRVRVFTASAELSHTLGPAALQSTVAWSRFNAGSEHPDALLAESLAQLGRHVLFARVEGVERVAMEVRIVENPDGTHEHSEIPHALRLGEVAVGYGYRAARVVGWDATIGLRGALTFVPDYLIADYDASRASGFAVFLNLRRSPLEHAHH